MNDRKINIQYKKCCRHDQDCCYKIYRMNECGEEKGNEKNCSLKRKPFVQELNKGYRFVF